MARCHRITSIVHPHDHTPFISRGLATCLIDCSCIATSWASTHDNIEPLHERASIAAQHEVANHCETILNWLNTIGNKPRNKLWRSTI